MNLFHQEAPVHPFIDQLRKQTPVCREVHSLQHLRRGFLLLPLAATVKSVPLSQSFLETHIVALSSSADFFGLTVNGIHLFRQGNVFYWRAAPGEPQPDGTQEASLPIPETRIDILDEGYLIINKQDVRIFIVNQPLTFAGCAWAVRPPATPTHDGPPSPSKHRLQDYDALVAPVQAARPLFPADEPSATDSPAPPVPKKPSENGLKIFREKMSQPEAQPLLSTVQLFIEKFNKENWAPDECGELVQTFYSDMHRAFAHNELWRSGPESHVDAAMEGLERYLMSKIYARAFAPIEDIEMDKKLHDRIEALQFIKKSHLDITLADSVVDDTLNTVVQDELRRMRQYKAPADKLAVLIGVCINVLNLLSHADRTRLAGADDFLPMLIYVLLKTNVESLYSNIHYIRRYRYAGKMHDEAGYYFTSILTGAAFLETVTADNLSIEPSEFEAEFAKGTARVAAAPHEKKSSPLLLDDLGTSLPRDSSFMLLPSASSFRDSGRFGELQPNALPLPPRPSVPMINPRLYHLTPADAKEADMDDLIREYRILADFVLRQAGIAPPAAPTVPQTEPQTEPQTAPGKEESESVSPPLPERVSPPLPERVPSGDLPGRDTPPILPDRAPPPSTPVQEYIPQEPEILEPSKSNEEFDSVSAS